jgi:hypothetical protein
MANGDYGKAAAKLIQGPGGRREGSGRKRKYLQVEPEEDLWYTIEAVAIKYGLTLEQAGSQLLNHRAREVRGQMAIARSQNYFSEKGSPRRRRRYNFPKKLNKGPDEPVLVDP